MAVFNPLEMRYEVSKLVEIYTDGACRGNPGPGGWGAVLMCEGKVKKIYGGEKETTNNRMELTAAIKALQALKKSSQVVLTTDSQYVKNGITEWLKNWKKNGWKTANKKLVKNIELWQVLDEEVSKHNIQWKWIKGHAGHQYNELADQLANRAIDEMK